MNTSAICLMCRRPQAQSECGLCAEPVCRSCALGVPEGAVAFWSETEVPAELGHQAYCSVCYGEQVEPRLAEYRELLERAREVFFFFDSRKKPVQVLKRARETIEVAACEDRDETILRLGFMAASQGFNAVVDAEVVGEKVRDHGWQKTRWRGRGWPARVDAERLERQTR